MRNRRWAKQFRHEVSLVEQRNSCVNPCEVFVETKAGKHKWKSVTLSLSHCPSQLLFPVHLCYFVSPTESQKHLLPGMPQALLSRIQSTKINLPTQQKQDQISIPWCSSNSISLYPYILEQNQKHEQPKQYAFSRSH